MILLAKIRKPHDKPASLIAHARFNPCFAEVNAFQGRYRILMGGAGSGKSCNLAQDFVCKMLDERFQDAHLLVVRKYASSHLDSTFAELCAAARRVCGPSWKTYFECSRSALLFRSRATSATALFRGMKDIDQREKIKSISAPHGKICWIWCEEATELDADDLELLDDRLRGALPPPLYYQISLSFNPVSASHWLKARFFDAPTEDAIVHTSTFRDNCFLDAHYETHMRQRAERDPEGYRVYGLGQWGRASGQILTHFSVADFPRDPSAFDALALGTDFGFNHPHATLLIGLRDGTLSLLDEWIGREMDTAEIAAALEAHFASRWPQLDAKAAIMWCDSAEPDRIKTLRRFGWNARPVKKGPGSVIAQIDWLRSHPLRVNADCAHAIEELQNWRWSQEPKSGRFLDEPAPGHDDAIAALRYGIEGWRRDAKIAF